MCSTECADQLGVLVRVRGPLGVLWTCPRLENVHPLYRVESDEPRLVLRAQQSPLHDLYLQMVKGTEEERYPGRLVDLFQLMMHVTEPPRSSVSLWWVNCLR